MTDILQYGSQNRDKLAAALGKVAPIAIGDAEVAKTKGAPELALVDTDGPDLELEIVPDEKAQKQRQNRERAEQIELFDRVRAAKSKGWAGAHMVAGTPNENAAGKGVGIVRWKMGVSAGFPDCVALVPRTWRGVDYHALFIELKCSDGRASDVEDSQRAWHDGLHDHGYAVVVAFGWRRAWSVLCEYMNWGERF